MLHAKGLLSIWSSVHQDIPIALDTTLAELDHAGTGTHIRCLSAALGRMLGDRLVPLRFQLGRPRNTKRALRDRAADFIRDVWWNQHAVVRAARSCGAGLLHLPASVGPVAGGIPKVVTIHDLSFLHFPEFFRRWFRTYATWVIPRLAHSARAVITVSQTSKADLINRLGLPEAKIFVIPNGVDRAFAPVAPGSDRGAAVASRYGLPAAFALTVGSIEPRKNLVRLMQAVERLRTRPETAELVLVHAGPYGWLGDDVERMAEKLRGAGAVRFIGYVPPADLPVLYSLARFMVYPSLFEGFGLPVLEAMACGCPVVASGIDALEEVAGPAAVFVDPYCVDAIADGLARVWRDPEERMVLKQRGRQRSGEFSWDSAARSTVEVYDRVLEGTV